MSGEVTVAGPGLQEALAKAQGAFGTVAKTRWNSFDGFAYATLAGILEAIRQPLAENGLAVLQFVSSTPQGISVVTRLQHVSGECEESPPLFLPVAKQTPQGYGAAITYARKYSLQALLCIASDGDLDADAQGETSNPSRRASRAPSAAQAYQASQEVAQAAEGGGPVVPFGKLKGKRVSELEERQLHWFSDQAKKKLEDPKAARYHEEQRTWLAALQAELARRTVAA